MFNNISFILHKPQLSENIGACARAIKNFSFKKLVIVNPKPIFPNDKILATSVGAKNIIINSKVYKSLESAVKKLEKYSGKNARAGEMFTEILKGAPAPVRATIRYNDLLRLWQLDKKYNLITQADKVKWIYLKDNPYKIEALAFFDYEMPDKVQAFLDAYADRQKVFDSILLNKLEGFFSDLQWSLDLNPYTNALASFEI